MEVKAAIGKQRNGVPRAASNELKTSTLTPAKSPLAEAALPPLSERRLSLSGTRSHLSYKGNVQETADFRQDSALPETPSLSPRHSPMSSSKFMALSAISKLMTQIYSFSSDLSPDLQRHIVNRSLFFPPGCLVRAQNELVTREPACSFVVNPSSFPLDYCYGLQNEFSPSSSLSLSLESPSVL